MVPVLQTERQEENNLLWITELRSGGTWIQALQWMPQAMLSRECFTSVYYFFSLKQAHKVIIFPILPCRK